MIKDADTRNHLDIMTTGLNGSDVLTSITAVCSAVCLLSAVLPPRLSLSN